MDAASLTLGRRDKGWVVGAGLLLDRAGQVEAGLPLRQSTSGIRRLPQRSLVSPCSVAEESTIYAGRTDPVSLLSRYLVSLNAGGIGNGDLSTSTYSGSK